jgi:hypothetical protein
VEDFTAFARLVNAIRPWLGHLTIVGGWAHRLHRFHPLASVPNHLPLQTRDVDLALSIHAPVVGDIRSALSAAGFREDFTGEHAPPITQYRLGDEDGGFYAEFLTPLLGGELKRDGRPDVTVSKAGITAQKLRHLELLLIAPWSVHIGPDMEIPVAAPVDVLLANPISFIIQKLLIHKYRKADKKAQDVLYIHDTLELFGASIDQLRSAWANDLRPAMATKTAKTATTMAADLFRDVTDTIRDAARIPQDRQLTPERVRALCEYGLNEILQIAT